MADEQSSESIFLKYDIFNAYDSLPYYKITDAEADHLYILVQAMRIELSLSSRPSPTRTTCSISSASS